MDSLIRLRQLNQPDISGYIAQVVFPTLQGSGITINGIALIPTGSGIFDLGTVTRYFDDLYVNDINVPFGSGIHFGNSFFTAYTSGGVGVIKIDNTYISGSGSTMTVIGPPGPSGATGVGVAGPSGASGISVTGAYGQNGYLYLVFSNHATSNPVALPSGATGVSLTGFNQSGNYVRPLYSNNTTGAYIQLASGAQGPAGIAGGIYIEMSDFSGFGCGSGHADLIVPFVSPDTTHSPTLNLVRGMRYTIGLSGLNLSTVTVGQGYVIPPGTYNTNYFVDEDHVTGVLKFALWDSTIPTGKYLNCDELNDGNYTAADIVSPTYLLNNQVLQNIQDSVYFSAVSFNLPLNAQDAYKYGFVRCDLAGNVLDGQNTNFYGGYVMGEIKTNYFGPPGPSGLQGLRGLDGAQGEDGPPGYGGAPGVGITGVNTRPNGNISSTDFQFLFSDNTSSAWITLPAGGAQGNPGRDGRDGTDGNCYSVTGTQGPQGLPGDTYYANFAPVQLYVDSTGNAVQVMRTGTSYWTTLVGNNIQFQANDTVRFHCQDLINKAYSPWQNILVADVYQANQNFYALVNSFSKTDGYITFLVTNTPSAPNGLVGGYIKLNSYSQITMNLGGLGSPGPSGASGPAGTIAVPAFTFRTVETLNGDGVNVVTRTIDTTAYSVWSFILNSSAPVNPAYIFNFNTANFVVGSTAQVMVKNNTQLTNASYQIISWDSHVKFPLGVIAPAPEPTYTSIYTFERYPDVGGVPQIYCTYALNYVT
jgi:hypothetical protein